MSSNDPRISLDFLDIAVEKTPILLCPVCKTIVWDKEGAKDGLTVHVNIPNLVDPIPPGIYLFRTWRGPAKLMMARYNAPLPEIFVCADKGCAQAVENFVNHEIEDWVERYDLSPHTGTTH